RVRPALLGHARARALRGPMAARSHAQRLEGRPEDDLPPPRLGLGTDSGTGPLQSATTTATTRRITKRMIATMTRARRFGFHGHDRQSRKVGSAKIARSLLIPPTMIRSCHPVKPTWDPLGPTSRGYSA